MRDIVISARVGLAFAIGSVLYAITTDHWSGLLPAVIFGSLGALAACWMRPEEVTKCLRFGWGGAYPNGESNIAALFREMKDARDALDALRIEVKLALEESRVILPTRTKDGTGR